MRNKTTTKSEKRSKKSSKLLKDLPLKRLAAGDAKAVKGGLPAVQKVRE